MEDKLKGESRALGDDNSTKNRKPEKQSLNKRNLETVLKEDGDAEGGSSKRQVNPKPTSSVSSCHRNVPPEQFAFSIDHVLEGILSSLDKNSLLQCRLVSHRWRLASSAVLKQTDVPISFTYDGRYQVHIISSSDPGSREFLNQFKLKDLTQFLKKSYTSTGPFTLNTFPCNMIVIRGGTAFNAEVQSFFGTYGKYIRNLYVDCTSEAPCTRHFQLVKMLDHILCVQVPNLEFFSFLMNWSYQFFNLSKKDIRGDQIQEAKNTRLHTLTTGSVPRIILESIIDICPNLKQINLDLKDMHLLIEPINRMNLLREFRIDAPYSPGFILDMLQQVEAAISSMPPGNPPVKFASVYVNFYRINLALDGVQQRSCLLRVINKILEGSWDTLESISFKNYDTDFALNGLRWPPVLPKARDITLCPLDSCGLELFPLDGTFRIQQSFPRLQEVTYNVFLGKIRNSRAEEFCNKLNLGPVLSVVRVKVNILLKRRTAGVGASERRQVRQHYSDTLLTKLFPRAERSMEFQRCQV